MTSSFVPHTFVNVATIIVVDRARVDASYLNDLLITLNGSGDYGEHVELLLRRSNGDLTMQSAFEQGCMPKVSYGPTLDEIAHCFGLPLYRVDDTSASFKWTVDIFNPLNAEARLDCYDPACEYIELAVDTRFKGGPLTHLTTEQLLAHHDALNRMLVRLWDRLKPRFLFGTADFHLTSMMLSQHFGVARKKPFPLSFERLCWPWAIYNPELRKTIKLSPTPPAPPSPIRFPYQLHAERRGLYLADLDDGSLLMFSLANERDDERQYCKVTGLKSVFEAPGIRSEKELYEAYHQT